MSPPARAGGGLCLDGSLTLAPPPLEHVSDVTGAGDALASGYLDGLLAGGSMQDNLTRGIALARLTASVRGPVRTDLSPELPGDALKQAVKAAADYVAG